MSRLIFSLCLLMSLAAIAASQQYDLVIEGGRVIDPETGLDAVRNVGVRDGKIVRISTEAKSGPAIDQPATPQQIEGMRERLRAELDAGGLAVGMGIQYTPGATRLEVIDMFRLAAERGLPVYTHARSTGRVEPGSAIEAVS